MLCAQVTSSSASMGAQTQEQLAISMATGLLSLTSRASLGMLVTAGVVRNIGLKAFYTRKHKNIT